MSETHFPANLIQAALECVSTPPSRMMINVNKFERLRTSFKVIHLRLDNRHRLIHLFIHLLSALS